MNKKTFVIVFYFLSMFLARSSATQPFRLEVIVFDFGGVIAQADVTQMADFLMQSFKINKEELSTALKNMQDFISNGGSEKEYWQQYACSKQISLSNHWIDEWATVIQKSISDISGSKEIVIALQENGYQTAMLSDVTQYQAEMIRKMGYYDLFSPVLLSYEIGLKKPDPEAFKKLLEKLHKPASSVIFIDDRVENVNAARDLGIDSIQFFNPEQLKRELVTRGIVLKND